MQPQHDASSPSTTKALSVGASWAGQVGLAVMVLAMCFFSVQLFASAGSGPPPVSGAHPPVRQASLGGAHMTFVRDVEGVRVDGEEIYQSRCATCHQMNGQGMSSVFPPLDGSEWVTGDKGQLIRIILHGVTGEMEVKGTTFSGAMPPWGSSMSDEQIAQVSTYVRTSWSNDTTAVTADEVARVRAATEGRNRPWTAKALGKEKNRTIPEPTSGE